MKRKSNKIMCKYMGQELEHPSVSIKHYKTLLRLSRRGNIQHKNYYNHVTSDHDHCQVSSVSMFTMRSDIRIKGLPCVSNTSSLFLYI